MNTLIVDDEPSGRKVLEEYLADVPFLTHVGSAENPVKAAALMAKANVQLLLLDIQMPKMNGLDFLKTLTRPPLVLLTTAFPQYALQGYELDIVDYLLKPVSFERFLKACLKAQELFAYRQQATTGTAALHDHFFVKHNGGYEKVRFSEVVYIEALENFVRIHTTGRGQLVAWLQLKQVEEVLPADQFIRVHRSYLVSMARIERLEGGEIVAGGRRIPVSKAMKTEVNNRILGPHLIRR